MYVVQHHRITQLPHPESHYKAFRPPPRQVLDSKNPKEPTAILTQHRTNPNISICKPIDSGIWKVYYAHLPSSKVSLSSRGA